MSGKVSKSQIPVVPQMRLPADVQAALIQLKNTLKDGRRLERFHNKNRGGSGSPLPTPANGCAYFEFQVGAAHSGDPESRGSRRLVVELNEKSRQILETYFTSEHYQKGTFVRVV